MSQKMPNGDFEWLSQDECRDMELLLNYADGRIAIFDSGLFDPLENKQDKNSFIIGTDLDYSPELHEWDYDYPFVLKVMTIELVKISTTCALSTLAPRAYTAKN